MTLQTQSPSGRKSWRLLLLTPVLTLLCCRLADAQSLDELLRQTSAAELVSQARADGDAARGAVVFFSSTWPARNAIRWAAPCLVARADLATLAKDLTDESLIESVLLPSKVIRKGYESVTLLTNDGQSIVGILVERTTENVIIRDTTRNGEQVTFVMSDLDEVVENAVSIMPAEQMNQLTSRQQFSGSDSVFDRNSRRRSCSCERTAAISLAADTEDS